MTIKQREGKKRSQKRRRLAGKVEPLNTLKPNAAGIDIGSSSHFVAVPSDRDDEPVREFSAFTSGLHALADWLQTCGVTTVAMESTGCTGYRSMTCCRSEALRFFWLMHSMFGVFQVASRMFWTANGFSSCIPTDFSDAAFVLTPSL